LILRPYQEAGRDFLAGRDRALLADEMRVGKTPQAVLAADAIGARRILVLSPAIGTEHWKRELRKWSPSRPDAYVLDPKRGVPPPCFGGTVIASYDLATRFKAQLRAQDWDVLVVDECHYAKNPTAQRTHLVYGTTGVGYAARFIWALSGTPAPRHAGELWPMLRAFGSVKCEFDEFVAAYCTQAPDGRITGTRKTAAAELNELLSSIMLRRTRKMVAPEMPGISFDFLEVSGAAPADLGAYGHMTDEELLAHLERHAGSAAELRIAVALAKVPPLVENINFVLGNKLMPRVVVFGFHTEPLERAALLLRDLGYKVGLITGKTPNAERTRIQDAFAAHQLDVVVGNIVAAGTVIDLSAASHGYMLELDWVPGNNLQAAYRMVSMQKNEPVTMDVVTWPGSFDDRVQRVLTRRANELALLY
jgi:SNF2 family DNA or RNA helicase